MKTLNLTDLEKSDIKYKISKFPDGQQNVTIDLVNAIFWGVEFSSIKVEIQSRLSNFKDLELIICTVKSLRSLGIKDISLYTPYFLGSRSDRKFENGGNNYLKDIICPIINSLNLNYVSVLDPHSYVLEACLNNFKTGNLSFFYDSAYTELKLNKDNTIVISPDAGAQKRTEYAAKQMRMNDIIICLKERDINGKLTKCVLPSNMNYSKDFVIVDDICDGGGTFINIAKVIKALQPDKYKLYLMVTHGIFSKGFGELQQYFDGIYTTNSYQNLQVEPFVKQFKII